MKPTFGLVPRTGVIPTWPYLDTHGPLARSVADAALLLDAIAAKREQVPATGAYLAPRTIAELLQCSQGTVRTQAKRALDKLQRLQPQLHETIGDR